jgi:hypothetical protein
MACANEIYNKLTMVNLMFMFLMKLLRIKKRENTLEEKQNVLIQIYFKNELRA